MFNGTWNGIQGNIGNLAWILLLMIESGQVDCYSSIECTLVV